MDQTTDPQLTDPALDDVLAGLAERIGLDLWMVTRRGGDDLSVVATHGDRLPVEPGFRVRWEDTVCARMAAGDGPRAAPVLADVPAYAAAPVARYLGLGAYVGVPIEGEGGVVGSLCGFDRGRLGSELTRELPTLELCAGLIGRLWTVEQEARTDPVTQLPNRRAWEEAIVREEERCRRFGHPAAVVAIDLDDFKRINDLVGHPAGDEHLRRTAKAVADSVRDHDVVARWGGDEFCVLGVECDEAAALALCRRIHHALRGAGVQASLAHARREDAGLAGAVRAAFAAMEREKRSETATSVG